MFKLLSKLVDSNEKEIERLKKIVDQINALESSSKKLSDEKLQAKTLEFKNRLEKGQSLDEILPDAFAAVREAARRTIGERHFDVQLMAGIALHEGKIAEQRTGEGKTLSSSTALYLNGLKGQGVHLVTVNDYLARRDCGWMGPIYHALGLTCAAIMHDAAFLYDPSFTDSQASDWRLMHLRPIAKKEAYAADITYGTNNEFGFDFLRDNMVWDLNQAAQRGHHFAIVDEVDSILIDEARTPLIISAPGEEATDKYYTFAKLVGELSPDTDYVIDEKLKTASLTEHGITKVEKKLGVENLYEKDFASIHHIEQSLRARTLYHKDKDYVVKDGEVIIVDEFTGRLLPGRRYSEGLHQAIEAKEQVAVQQESKTLATISFQNYFRMYGKLAGMTGTAATEAEEFHKIYGLDVVIVPTNKPMIRKDLSDVVYKNPTVKFTAVANEIAKRHQAGQPILLGTTSIEKNEVLAQLLKRKGIPHNILNAKNHEREAEFIAQAGEKGSVTLATNIAGRGVDIILGGKPPVDEWGRLKLDSKEFKEWEKKHEEVIRLGGLHVIGTERHEARRVDNQLRGRAGRQGDPGSSQFFVSLEDDIMRLFGGEQVAKIMTTFKLPEDTPISHAMVSKAIENAQVKVEGFNFDIRKHLVEYDDVMNKQRELIYSQRRKILESVAKDGGQAPLREEILEKLRTEVETLVLMHMGEVGTDEEYERVVKEYSTIIPFDEPSLKKLLEEVKKEKGPQKIIDFLYGLGDNLYKQREENFGADVSSQVERMVMLSVIDTLWMEHLDTMDDLREGVRLRAAGQLDPLVEYKKEGFSLFERLLKSIDYEVTRRIFKIQVQPARQDQAPASRTQLQEQPVVAQHPSVTTSGATANPGNLEKKKKIGRNDPCWCGRVDESGKPIKWKKCHYPELPV